MPSHRNHWIALGLAGLTLAVFLQARHHDFVDLDDPAFVAAARYLDDGISLHSLATDFTVAHPFWSWTPLATISYRLNHAVHGREPAGYILTNIALHLLATLALFFALERMTAASWPSAFVAAVFAVHPLHVESVVWVSERRDVLAGFFWMAGLLAYARYAQRPAAARYALVFVCLALGLLSKPLMVTFPFALLLLDYWPLQRLSRRAVLEKLPMLGLVVVASALTWWVQDRVIPVSFAESQGLTLDLRLRNAADSYLLYLFQTFWPAGLTVYYPHPLGNLSLARATGAAVVLAGATGFALWAARPWLIVGWLWFLGVLVPMIGVVQVGGQARADRFMYVPLVGLAISVAWGVAEFRGTGRRRRALLAATGVAAVVALAVVAHFQVRHWRNSETLFEHNVSLEPGSMFGQRGLGYVRMQQGRLEEAERHLEAAYALRPERVRFDFVRLQLLFAKRAREGADLGEAIARYEKALTLDPDHARAHALLALALADAGRTAEAIAQGREALRLAPTLDWAANNLAWLLATCSDPILRDPPEAVRLAQAAVARKRPPDPDYLETLAVAYAAAGRFDAAAATAERAAALAQESGNAALAKRSAGAARPLPRRPPIAAPSKRFLAFAQFLGPWCRDPLDCRTDSGNTWTRRNRTLGKGDPDANSCALVGAAAGGGDPWVGFGGLGRRYVQLGAREAGEPSLSTPFR